MAVGCLSGGAGHPMNNVLDTLRERGLLEAVTSPDIHKALESPVTLYAGFDPTSRSLQVGNLSIMMVLAHFQRAGHRVVAVVGGATGRIGDPSGKSTSRDFLTDEEVERNLTGIRADLGKVLDLKNVRAPVKIVDNNDWMKQVDFVRFLREVGRHFRMGVMLGKESVKARLDGEAGMSFAEFSYQLLQAYDFLKLYDTEKCILQVGGSDQWGNITAGIDLIRKLRGVEAYGVTMPLVCDSTGKKFGKSEGNALYLSPEMTSCYAFYQFFVRVPDADVIRYLRVYTFLPLSEIADLERQLKEAPEQRSAQKRLAEEIARMVHGETGLQSARRASEVLFGGSLEGLTARELQEIFADVPSAELSRSVVDGVAVVEVAAAAGLCKSKGEARRLIESGGLYLNNRRVAEVGAKVASTDVVDGQVLVLRSGRKTFHLVRVK